MATESKTVPVHVAAQMVPIKLTEDNYFLWKSLVVPVLKQYDMFNVVQGRDQQSPPLSVKDQNCLNFIKLTMSVSMLPHAVGCSTAGALWLTLEEQGNKMAQSRLEQMSCDLQTLKKGSFMSMRSYYESARTIPNMLASAGSPVSDRDFVKYLLRGLPADYGAFVNKIRARYDGVTPEKLYSLLVEEEAWRRLKLCRRVIKYGLYGTIVCASFWFGCHCGYDIIPGKAIRIVTPFIPGRCIYIYRPPKH